MTDQKAKIVQAVFDYLRPKKKKHKRNRRRVDAKQGKLFEQETKK